MSERSAVRTNLVEDTASDRASLTGREADRPVLFRDSGYRLTDEPAIDGGRGGRRCECSSAAGGSWTMSWG